MRHGRFKAVSTSSSSRNTKALLPDVCKHARTYLFTILGHVRRSSHLVANPVAAVQSNTRDRYSPPYPSLGYLLFTVKEINSGSFRACLRYSRDRLKSAKEIRVSSRP